MAVSSRLMIRDDRTSVALRWEEPLASPPPAPCPAPRGSPESLLLIRERLSPSPNFLFFPRGSQHLWDTFL